MSNQAMYRRLQRVANRQGGQFATLGAYDYPAAERATQTPPVVSPRELMEEMIEEQRRALAAELLKIRAEHPEANLPEEALACGVAATRIYPDLPPETEEAPDAP